ncbi:aldehyde dehydrogenase (NADP(+)) [Pedobacter glucosidilyticus]|uniref:aldehyde dehydrogenase (NADP(+)) n=1 Tax=Pedobacter glucosidilyticus TaxID=1122941 RepID=UPI0004078EA9|nr:aldehyde dehydrogenase (NADP(+)) [Pedobacter glucosidilyticus]
MDITGKHLINGEFVARGNTSFNAHFADGDKNLTHSFYEATLQEVSDACNAAQKAFEAYKLKSDTKRAEFLEEIALEIAALTKPLVETAQKETGLPEARLNGEIGRTTSQLNLFAKLLKDGHWVNAIIDEAQPERLPLPKADIRMLQVPLGPVAVFGASNFPFAFSVAGGDTVSALAAGCPVVFKAHPAHPATCEIVAQAIKKAIIKCQMPLGVFNMLQGQTHETGGALVQNDLITAVGFTGSFKGGKALYDLATRRACPIPVYAEMGSVNPVFFLPGILKEKKEELAKGLAASVTLGVGQFCTNPGLFVVEQSEQADGFIKQTASDLSSITLGPMLTPAIKKAFIDGIHHIKQENGVTSLTQDAQNAEVRPQLLLSQVDTVIRNEKIMEEVFGPSTVAVSAANVSEVIKFAKSLKGHLTATVFGTDDDLKQYQELIHILQQKVGRLIFNNFPTGVEVTHAMVHGGPYPATTDARSTSVGTTAIYRFTRPLCFQNCPDDLLPDALKRGNPLNIIRTVNGVSSKN